MQGLEVSKYGIVRCSGFILVMLAGSNWRVLSRGDNDLVFVLKGSHPCSISIALTLKL